jgi:hypothetical protein
LVVDNKRNSGVAFSDWVVVGGWACDGKTYRVSAFYGEIICGVEGYPK